MEKFYNFRQNARGGEVCSITLAGISPAKQLGYLAAARKNRYRSWDWRLMKKYVGSFLAFLSIALAGRVEAQVATAFAQLNGAVIDVSGGAIEKAVISLHELDTNQVYATATNAEGLYAVANLPPGRYELTVEANAFAKYTQSGITLRVGQTATSDIRLDIA